jgi:hypothetical protein
MMIRKRLYRSQASWSGAAALALLASTLLQAQPAGSGAAAPRVGPNVRLNAPQRPFPEGKLGRAGVAIAADVEGRRLVAAWDSILGTCGPPYGEACPPPSPPGLTAFGYSTDGGRSWTDAGSPRPVDGAMTAGHPWLDRGGVDNRTFFLANRARSLVDRAQVGLTFHRGRFRGDIFEWEEGRLLRPAKPGDIWRSPSLAAAKDGSGKVYVAFSSLREVCGVAGRSAGQIELLRSADEGKTWEGPTVVGIDDTPVTPDPKDPRCAQSGSFQFATNVALGPGGEVFVIWQFGPFANAQPPEAGPTAGIRFARSLDDGRTFTATRDVAVVNALWENPPAGFSKDNLSNYPRITVALDGSHRGRIYVTYASSIAPVDALATEQSLVSSQVYLIHSDNLGGTWSTPVPLGPPVPASGVKRFWPTAAVHPGGEVSVVYTESREEQATANPDDLECNTRLLSGLFRTGKASSLVDVYWVRSTDGGDTFGRPVRVTSETSNWCRVGYDSAGFLFSNFGDYLGVFPTGDRLFAVWTDGRNGVPDAYFAELVDSGGGN